MTDNTGNLLERAMATVLRELEGIPQDQDVEIAGIAPYFRTAALRAITDIEDLAGLLLRSIDPGPPLDVSILAAICKDIVRPAASLASTFPLWLWVLGKDREAGRLHFLPMMADAACEHAENLAQADRYADAGTPMSDDDQAALARALLLFVNYLRQELTATPPTPRPPGDPARATTGETP